MLTSNKLNTTIASILSIARYAPSVHNTQPWLVSTRNDEVVVKVDPRFKLIDGDPTGRQTIISLGIFAEAIILAATKYKFECTTLKFNNSSVVIKLKQNDNLAQNVNAVDSLKSRVTDRSIYKSVMLSDDMKKRIIGSTKDTKAQSWIITDETAINKIANLTAKGIGVALSSPNFRKELSQYLIVPWSSKTRGISTSSLYIPKVLSVLQPVLMRSGLGVKPEVKLEKQRWLSASGVILITTSGDMPNYWFEAGRAYLKIALKIEELGLSQATSAATVEASNYHEDVERLVNTKQRLQCVIRIGKGAKKRSHSPRVTAEELIT